MWNGDPIIRARLHQRDDRDDRVHGYGDEPDPPVYGAQADRRTCTVGVHFQRALDRDVFICAGDLLIDRRRPYRTRNPQFGSGSTGEACLTTGALFVSARFFLWHLLDEVPLLSINKTLHWNEPLEYRGWVGPFLLLFKVAVIGPAITAFAFYAGRSRAEPAPEMT